MEMNRYPIKIRQCGQLTLPRCIRDEWSTHDGDVMTLVQMGEFAILAPATLNTTALARQFSQLMDEEGITLADLLEGLAEEREHSLEKYATTDAQA